VGGGLGFSVKLPVSAASALEMPFTEPTGYGLGKHGWVTAQFPTSDEVPLDLLREWIDESFRAVAPKSVLAQLEAGETIERRRKSRRESGSRRGRPMGSSERPHASRGISCRASPYLFPGG